MKEGVDSVCCCHRQPELARPSPRRCAQSRPLVTEDPETVPAGNILLEAGIDYAQDVAFPVSGLRGNLWRIGTFGLSFGVSSIAEIQIDGGLRNRLAITTFDPTAPLADMLDDHGREHRRLRRIS